MFRKVLTAEKIPFPQYLAFKKNDPPELVWRFFKKPSVFVKPYNQGSSVGASVVHGKEELKKALNLALAYSEPVLVEEYLKGMEISCAVLGNANPQALPLAEILPKNEFFDYEAKYTEGKSEEIVPARLSPKMTKKIQDLSVRIFKAIGARGVARVEFIVVGQRPYALEINTIPGLTSASIVPKEAKEAGIPYAKLLDKIINYALEENLA